MGRKKEEINPRCGERIRQLCKVKKIEQKKLAAMIQYSPNTISQVVNSHRGLTRELAEAIVEVYPDISIDWLLGDPDAKMNDREAFYLTFKDTLQKLRALEKLLAFTDFTIDYENPYEIEGIRNEFCNIYYQNTSVALSERQRNALVDTIIKMIESFLMWIVKSGKSAKQLAGECSDFGIYYLNDFCDYILYDADTDLDDKEKGAISQFVKYASQCIGSRSYEYLIHPGQSKSDALKEEFKEFQDE